MPAGRPPKYDPDYHPEKAHKLALLMATDDEVADFFEIHFDTLQAWKREHAEFSYSIARGKLIADAEVAEKLKHRAMGYSHESVKIFMPAGAEKPVYAPYTEHFPPDTQAASLWLRNRQKGRWRDKQDHEHGGPDGGPIELAVLTAAERAERAGKLIDDAFTALPKPDEK